MHEMAPTLPHIKSNNVDSLLQEMKNQGVKRECHVGFYKHSHLTSEHKLRTENYHFHIELQRSRLIHRNGS